MTTVTYQGTYGAFSHQAGEAYFKDANLRGCLTFAEALKQVKEGDVDYAIIPIDNSMTGRVAEVYNILPEAELFIVGEYFMPIHFCLMMPTKSVRGRPSENMTREELVEWKNRDPNQEEIKSAFSRITDIYSHQQGFLLCNNFIKKHFPHAKLHETWDTAGAARDIAIEAKPNSAAIAPLKAVRYEMTVLSENIEDDVANTTRFLVLSKEALPLSEVTEPAITTLMFQTTNKAGSLVTALEVFKENGVNLTKLETYMMGKKHSEPHFYVDAEMNMAKPIGQKTIADLKNKSLDIKLLGTYKSAR